MTTIAQFGLGGLGRTHLDAFTDLPGVEVLAGADPFDDARESFARDYGAAGHRSYEGLLAEHAAELDAVNVVTPHSLHFEQAMAALDAGLSVHLEKPMVTGLDDALRLTDAAADTEASVQVGYQRHFDPRFRAVRETILSGAIGEVVGANCFLEQDWIQPVSGTWRTDPSLSGGGQLYDSGSHLLDALLWTTDTRPRSVGAVVEANDADVDVHSSLSLSLERGGRTVPASVFVTGDGPTGPDTREGLYVWGTDGSVEYGPDGVVVRQKGGGTSWEDVPEYDSPELERRKLGAFVETVDGERANPVPPETGLDVIAVTEAAYQASDGGRTVDVQRLLRDARPAA
ncbi:Predicted dehydrogenase [Halomicrobium zhouii]|uniref:Predicted dehydrogenase n=1 Tax=Halomicrobium zhouii TaxID=767519 RepID=A0A1I6KKZ1_9EURY|nr:Gfo/Idh/MocA family oxidoreductase [Halomicrobium zhouii]SFR91824.1 Predicted dehydrogenase [Halomicrobium zhouii]